MPRHLALESGHDMCCCISVVNRNRVRNQAKIPSKKFHNIVPLGQRGMCVSLLTTHKVSPSTCSVTMDPCDY